MSDYPSRVRKSEEMYELWESGFGDMKELAIGLHDLTAQYKALYDDYIKLEAERDALVEAMDEIIQWANAYPLDVFPEPDLEKAHELLKAGGMTLDAVSASGMRRVLDGVVKIAEKATRKEIEDA